MGLATAAGMALRLWARRKSLANAADRLGMEHDAKEQKLRGFGSGRRVELDPGGQGFTIEPRATAFLDPPLDLGLRVTKRSSWDPGFSGISLPIRGFTDRYLVEADEVGRAMALLDADLQRAIESAAETFGDVTVRDDGVVLTGSRNELERDRWLRTILARSEELADAVERSSRNVPVAAALVRYLGEWSEWAQARGLRVDNTPLRASGRLGDLDVAAWFERAANGRHRLLVRVDLGVSTRALSASDNEQLAELARQGGVEVRDDALFLFSSLDHEPPGLPVHMVDQAIATAGRIREWVSAKQAMAGGSGPYR